MSQKGTITTSDYLDYDEFKRLVKCLNDDKQHLWAFYCILSFCLGLRSSDIRKLKWKDIVNTRTLTMTEKKTGKTKNIPIGNSAAGHIQEMYELIRPQVLDSYVFATENSGDKPVSIQYVNKIMKKWKDKYNLDVENFSTHTFRKTFGRYVYEKGNRSNEALLRLNRIFRHSNFQTTLIYIGVTDDSINKVFNSIDV